mgnify:CR=1 FL=1
MWLPFIQNAYQAISTAIRTQSWTETIRADTDWLNVLSMLCSLAVIVRGLSLFLSTFLQQLVENIGAACAPQEEGRHHGELCKTWWTQTPLSYAFLSTLTNRGKRPLRSLQTIRHLSPNSSSSGSSRLCPAWTTYMLVAEWKWKILDDHRDNATVLNLISCIDAKLGEPSWRGRQTRIEALDFDLNMSCHLLAKTQNVLLFCSKPSS